MPAEQRALTCMGLSLSISFSCGSSSHLSGTIFDVPRGARLSARIITPHTCIRWIDQTRTMMQ